MAALPVRILCLFAILGCGLPVAAAQSAVVPIELPNGLRLIVQEDHRLPRVAVAVSYAVGFRDDPPNRSGLAHLVEHAMCGPTRHVPEGVHAYFERLGATVEASTHSDYTLMAEELPSELWETALWLESDRMGFVLSAVDDDELGRIRDVVNRELEERTANHDPSGNELLAELYPGDHPYHRGAVQAADANDIELDDVRWFFQRHYAPASAVLAVVGDVDTAQVESAVRKYFGPIRASRLFQPRAVTTINTPRLTRDRKTVVLPALYENWRWERLLIGWLTPPRFSFGDVELDVAQIVLRERLRKRLLATQQVFSVSVQHPSWELSSPFMISLDILPRYSIDTVLASVLDEVAQLGTSDAEIERARRGLAMLRLRNADAWFRRATSLATSMTLGKTESLEAINDSYEHVDVRGVRQAIEQYLSHAKHVVIRREFSRFGSRPKQIVR